MDEAKGGAKDEASDVKEDVKEQVAEAVKASTAEASAAIRPITKKEHIVEQLVQRDERVLSAKERYLARKRQQQESGQEAPA